MALGPDDAEWAVGTVVGNKGNRVVIVQYLDGTLAECHARHLRFLPEEELFVREDDTKVDIDPQEPKPFGDPEMNNETEAVKPPEDQKDTQDEEEKKKEEKKKEEKKEEEKKEEEKTEPEKNPDTKTEEEKETSEKKLIEGEIQRILQNNYESLRLGALSEKFDVKPTLFTHVVVKSATVKLGVRHLEKITGKGCHFVFSRQTAKVTQKTRNERRFKNKIPMVVTVLYEGLKNSAAGVLGNLRDSGQQKVTKGADLTKLDPKLYQVVPEEQRGEGSLESLTAKQLRWLCRFYGCPLASGVPALKTKLKQFFNRQKAAFLCPACNGVEQMHYYNEHCAFGCCNLAEALLGTEEEEPTEEEDSETFECFHASGDTREETFLTEFKYEKAYLSLKRRTNLGLGKNLFDGLLNKSNNYSLSLTQS